MDTPENQKAKQQEEFAKRLVSRYESLLSHREGTWDTIWHECMDFVMPRKATVAETKSPGIGEWTEGLFDSEAIEANQIMASGMYDYLVAGKFFEFVPEDIKDASEDMKAWCRQVTDITLEILDGTNFSTEIHELLLDRGVGPAHLHVEEDDETVLNFSNADIGDYVCDQNHRSKIDTIIVSREMNARQIAQKYGEDAMSPRMRECYKDATKAEGTKFEVLHFIMPRDDRSVFKETPDNMPIASIHIERTTKHILLESGYEEMPSFVTRYLKWGKEVYGWSPAIMALPTAKSLNFLEYYLDALVEAKVLPRALIPEGMEGQVEFHASGITFFDPHTPNAKPEEWLTAGDYQIGVDRAQHKRDMIRRFFHVDLFQLLTNMDEVKREKTAYEVQQMLAEKLVRVSPTFSQMKDELWRPMLQRVFAILLRAGYYPDPPEELIQRTQDGTGDAILQVPQVRLKSKLAMALESLENEAFIGFFAIVADLVNVVGTVRPDRVDEILDPIDFEKVVKGISQRKGVPVDFLRDEADLEALKIARAQAAEAQAAMEAAQAGASAMKDASQGMPMLNRLESPQLLPNGN